MKILLVTTVVSPHMMPLTSAIEQIVGKGNIIYVATMPFLGWRKEMGWSSDSQFENVLQPYESTADAVTAERLWDEADVVISAVRDIVHLKRRISQNKLTFYTSERWWKPPFGKIRLWLPKWNILLKQFALLSKSEAFHYLPMGIYARQDLSGHTQFGKRDWLWGYYTEATQNIRVAPTPSNARMDVLFVGRMIDWKRPCDVIRAFAMLVDQHPSATLTMIGDGPEKQRVKNLAHKLGIENALTMIPSQPMREIWSRMAQADIFIQSSNAQEGWGAVINEAMSQGCAVVASNASGAAATMIRHGENGMLYDAGDWRMLGKHLLTLAENRELLRQLGTAGKKDLDTLWSPDNAARRFVGVAEALLAGTPTPRYESGPMSQLAQ